MALTAGTRLGPYVIESPLGAGGMGEVYRAQDSRLNRRVAIKLLASRFGTDRDLRLRFEREAQALAGLTHPHICTLYDVGHQDGADFLVMEFLEGETLAARLLEGRLAPDQVLAYAIEIADALDKAHRSGIVHRDLKPGNIMLTKSGTKLLDFGLAKASRTLIAEFGGTGLEPEPVTSPPTSPVSLTAQGVIIGTLQYMAPEQLAGKKVDARTDIFAIGAVICEMATGQRAFQGPTDISLIAAILEHEPLAISSSPPLDRLVKRCLAKDPELRWQNAQDLKVALEWIAEAAPSVRESTRHPRIPWAIATVTTLAAALTLALPNVLDRPAHQAPRSISRLTIPITTKEPQFVTQFQMALSRDGTRLVYSAGSLNLTHLYVRSLDSFDTTLIDGVETASNPSPFFSPDGQWVAFHAGGKLLKVPVAGGVPQTICVLPAEVGQTSSLEGADWSADDTIYFAFDTTGARTTETAGLWKVRASGGTPQIVTTPDKKKGEISHFNPQVLPGGKAVLFAIQGPGVNEFHIAVESLDTHVHRDVTAKGIFAAYVSTGHMVYGSGGSLLARGFDLARLEATGPEVEILRPQADGTGVFELDWSDNGTLVYALLGARAEARSLVWVDRHGKEGPFPAPKRVYSQPRLSADGKRLAVVIVDGIRSDNWTYDLERNVLHRLTNDGMSDAAEWHPDDKRVVFSSWRSGPRNLFIQAADGTGQPERLIPSGNSQWAGSWSADGSRMAFMEFNGTTLGDILVLENGARQAQPLLRVPATQWGGRISPDGRWLAYVSDESGKFEVYVTSFPSAQGKWQLSTDGGAEVAWARNGRELYWRHDNTMMAARIKPGPRFNWDPAEPLFSGYMKGLPGEHEYDVSSDGRFLMVKGTEVESTPAYVNVVLNWFEDLKSKVGAAPKR